MRSYRYVGLLVMNIQHIISNTSLKVEELSEYCKFIAAYE
ncbi:hypothetical protein IMCC1989_2565 [gamma proteobacterium IMCC1989]|nr:hypothetical protein IMCC1989_2565 [gamma proteobacterium IMCC1989]